MANSAPFALRLKQAYPDCRVLALDNLKRRGSELNLPHLRAGLQCRRQPLRQLPDAGPIVLCQEITGNKISQSYSAQNRVGDHIR